ncbi:hypothetical protein SODG_007566 [Sodalis praecaptivus]
MLRTIKLKGALGKRFGRTHRYHVADVKEALRALCVTLPGFEKYMSNAHHDGIRFAFFNGEENIGIAQFEMSKGDRDIVIMPVIEGAKGGGFYRWCWVPPRWPGPFYRRDVTGAVRRGGINPAYRPRDLDAAGRGGAADDAAAQLRRREIIEC